MRQNRRISMQKLIRYEVDKKEKEMRTDEMTEIVNDFAGEALC